MKSKLILLVEDNPDDIELIRRALRKNNIHSELIVMQDGAEAINYLFSTPALESKCSRTPDLILLDIKLPKVDGLEVLRKIRSDQQTRLIPVVILTSSKEEQDRLKGYTLGANSYIQKPVNFTEFTDAVRDLGLYWLLLNEPAPSDLQKFKTA